MKKLFLSLILLFTGIALASCSATSTEAVEFQSDDQVFALEAISASSLLDLSSLSTVSLPLANSKTTTTTSSDDTEPVISQDIETIDKYLEMMERFLGTNDLLNMTNIASDKEGYDYKIIYTTVDLLGNAKEYVLYYNEVVYETTDTSTLDDTTTTQDDTATTTTTEDDTATTTTTTTTEEETTTPVYQQGDKDRDYYFNDSDEDELVTYYISGILVDGDLEYNVEGKLITLEDGTVFRLRSFIDKDNFVKVDYKAEVNETEQKFFYEVVTDGQVVYKSKIKIVEENSNLKVHLEITENDTTLKLLFSQEIEDDITIIKILYTVEDLTGIIDSGHIKIYKSIDPETLEVIYDYKILSNQKQHAFDYQSRSHKFQENKSSEIDSKSDVSILIEDSLNIC